MKPMAFLLPHELLHQLGAHGDSTTLTSKLGLDRVTSEHIQSVQQILKKEVAALSFWADGVPFSWDRKKSIECWVMSLPGLPDPKDQQLRFPLVVYPAEMQSVNTPDAVMKVLSASLRVSASGVFPGERLDGRPFQEGDGWRKRRANQPLALTGVVGMIRGDWKFFKDLWGYNRKTPSLQTKGQAMHSILSFQACFGCHQPIFCHHTPWAPTLT